MHRVNRLGKSARSSFLRHKLKAVSTTAPKRGLISPVAHASGGMLLVLEYPAVSLHQTPRFLWLESPDGVGPRSSRVQSDGQNSVSAFHDSTRYSAYAVPPERTVNKGLPVRKDGKSFTHATRTMSSL